MKAKIFIIIAVICAVGFLAGNSWAGGSKSHNIVKQQGNTGHAIDSASQDGQGDGSIPVPEPATLMLLGTGLVGLAAVAHRKLFKQK